MYNLTGIDNANTTYQFAKAVNQLPTLQGLPNGFIFIVFLYAFWIVMITVMITRFNEKGTALAVSSIICAFVGFIMFFLEFIPWEPITIPIVCMFVGIIMTLMFQA